MGRYRPAAAWLKAGLYFGLCLAAAQATGVFDAVRAAPLASAAQWGDPRWQASTALAAIVIAVGYGLIWPRGTFTDGRRSHPLLSLGYGLSWGVCQGLWFLSLWALLAATGLAQPWLALAAGLAIGTYNALWHRFVWDIHVSPPHNYTEWNARKVLLCHVPNLIVSLSHYAVHGNAALYVLSQGLALALSAWAMRFPAPWDDYRAIPGEERTRAITGALR